MVGGNSLFNPDVTEMNTCADAAGQPTGIPNISALANDVNEQCAKNAYIIQGIAETCPAGWRRLRPAVRHLKAFVGTAKYYETIASPLKGIFLVPGDLPTTVQSATFQIEGQAQAGVEWVGAVEGVGPRRAVGLHADRADRSATRAATTSTTARTTPS